MAMNIKCGRLSIMPRGVRHAQVPYNDRAASIQTVTSIDARLIPFQGLCCLMYPKHHKNNDEAVSGNFSISGAQILFADRY